MNRAWVTGICGAALAGLAACGGAGGPDMSELESEYNPALGAGVNFSETKTFRTCINSTEVEPTPLALERLYNETRIRSRRELHKTLDVSASVSAKGTWGSAGGSMSYFKNVKIKDQAFYWTVDANYAVTEERVITNDAEFGLTQAAKDILNNHGVEAFYNACGTHFYSGRKLGGRYTLLYEFNSHEDEVVERLKARANYSGFGVDASAEFEKFLRLAEKASILKIHSRIVGGGDSIKDYATDPQKLKDELQTLRTDLLQHRRGVVMEWFLSSYDMFPEVIAKKQEEGIDRIQDAFRNDALGHYYNLYAANQKKISKLNHRIDASQGREPLYIYSDEKIRQMQEAINELLAQNDLIEDRARACVRGEGDCLREGLAPITVSLPEPDKDLSGLGPWTLFAYPADDGGGQVTNVNFMGQPGSEYDTRIFQASDRVFETQAGAFVTTDGDAGPRTVRIGNFDRVVDPDTGNPRPNVCIGDYDDTCNMRVIENPNVQEDDGYPVSRLRLTVFDKYGFIKDRKDFLARP